MATAARKVEKTDNLAPPLVSKDQLEKDFAHLIKEVADLEAESTDLPNVAEDDEDLALITATAGKIIKSAKKIDEKKKEEKRPYLDASNDLEDFFAHGLGARLAKIKADLEKVSTAYQRKKAAREQAVRDAQAATARQAAEEAAQKVTEAVKTGDVKAATTAVTE